MGNGHPFADTGAHDLFAAFHSGQKAIGKTQASAICHKLGQILQALTFGVESIDDPD